LDSSVDKTQFGGSELARRVARASLLESQKTRNLGEREPHGLRALDEPQSVGIALAVAADSTERSWRFRDQSQALVIPNGLNVNAGRRSQARDSVGARHEP
jgi:hypothetical protein